MATESAQRLLRQPLYLLSGTRSLFGWLYRPPGEAGASLGLVICRPFGLEALCSHCSVRAFAAAAAGAGVPTLCFDYGGTGDSEDLEPQANQLEAWTDDVFAAVCELQRRTGVERVCLLGLRLGALLAARAALLSDAVDALIAVAPVVSGARYLRELRMTALAQAAQRTASAADATDASAPGASDIATLGSSGALEVNGYELSAATAAALAQTDLMTLTRSPVSELLLLDRRDVPAAAPWVQAMARLGAHSDYQVLPGLAEMMMATTVYTAVPREMLSAARDWLLRLQGAWQAKLAADGTSVASRVAAGCAAPSMPLALRAEAHMPRAELVEHALLFGSDPVLFGVVTEPHSGPTRAGAIILLNDGVNLHIGSNRMAVLLARLWARQGHAVLRMDLAGLGDSATRAGCPANQVFPAAAMQDIRSAIELMHARYGPCEITLGGLCSGAYHAYRAAAEGLAVARLILVNQRDFFWRADLNGNYLRRLRLGLGSMSRGLGSALHLHLPRDLGWELERTVAGGVRPIFIFSRNDPGWRQLHMLAGSALARLNGRCRVRIIDGSDHAFTGSAARTRLQQVLTDELSAGGIAAKAGSDEVRAAGAGRAAPPHVAPLSSSV